MSSPAIAPAAGEVVLDGIHKRFLGKAVLSDIGFTATHGEFVTLLGPSGCGKTTLLRIIAGFEVVDAGRIVLCGTDITALPANRRPVNTVFQHFALFPHLSVAENIAFGLRSRRLPEHLIAGKLAEASGLLHLEQLMARRPARLSGGEQQRVALARALVNEPQLLLLDEPMSALDAQLRTALQLELRQLQRRLRTTFLLVTHDQDEAMAVSDRILVMQGGRIIQGGPPDQVYDRPRTRFVASFIGRANLLEATRRSDGAVETALGTLTMPAPPPWERGTLAIRPERIRILDHGSQEGLPAPALTAVVAGTVFRGDHLEVQLHAGPTRQAVRCHAGMDSTLRDGQQVRLEILGEDLRVLDD